MKEKSPESTYKRIQSILGKIVPNKSTSKDELVGFLDLKKINTLWVLWALTKENKTGIKFLNSNKKKDRRETISRYLRKMWTKDFKSSCFQGYKTLFLNAIVQKIFIVDLRWSEIVLTLLPLISKLLPLESGLQWLLWPIEYYGSHAESVFRFRL